MVSSFGSSPEGDLEQNPFGRRKYVFGLKGKKSTCNAKHRATPQSENPWKLLSLKDAVRIRSPCLCHSEGPDLPRPLRLGWNVRSHSVAISRQKQRVFALHTIHKFEDGFSQLAQRAGNQN